jgi:hypothetical protein
LYLYIEAQRLKGEREYDKEKGAWKRTRLMYVQFHNANYKSQKKLTDLVRFPEDDEEVAEEKVSTRLTPEEVELKFNKRGRN